MDGADENVEPTNFDEKNEFSTIPSTAPLTVSRSPQTRLDTHCVKVDNETVKRDE